MYCSLPFSLLLLSLELSSDLLPHSRASGESGKEHGQTDQTGFKLHPTNRSGRKEHVKEIRSKGPDKNKTVIADLLQPSTSLGLALGDNALKTLTLLVEAENAEVVNGTEIQQGHSLHHAKHAEAGLAHNLEPHIKALITLSDVGRPSCTEGVQEAEEADEAPRDVDLTA
ncbi:hypothetical protein HG530_009790 [Fusarium avenaceum]|nr:hypothetical protein HG530_009790 [Fusarium avenaceum]